MTISLLNDDQQKFTDAITTADDHFLHIDMLADELNDPEVSDWLANNTRGSYSARILTDWLTENCAIRFYFTEERDIVLFKLFFS